MSFFESPRFPESISYGASGGPGYVTDVVTLNSGFEQRNAAWADARAVYDVSHGLKKQADMDAMIAFFRTCKGRAHGFRYKDWMDYQVTLSSCAFLQLSATRFQMQKKYISGANLELRNIKKPVVGTVTINGGQSPNIDYNTGIVTVTSGAPYSWTGEFDVPCRFDTDQMKVNIDTFAIYSWGNIPVVEVRV